MFEDAINDVVCGNAYRTVVPRAKVAKACESVVSSVLARKAFADREDLALTICGSMCPCEGDRNPFFHASQVGYDLEQLQVVKIRNSGDSPLLTGSRKGLRYLRHFEGVKAKTIQDLIQEHLPKYSPVKVQTLLCIYAKYVVAFNCGLGRWYVGKTCTRRKWMMIRKK